MKAILTALVLAVGLSGCGLFKTKSPVEHIVYKFIRVPVQLTEKVNITSPPDPAPYSVLPWDEKEAMLMGLIQNHTRTIGMCNVRLIGINAWSLQQLKIYEPTNP